MHDIEHKSEQDDSAVEVTPLQPQEKRTFTPAQNGSTTAEGQKLPRAWRYAIAGGIVLLVLAVIFAGITQADGKPDLSSQVNTCDQFLISSYTCNKANPIACMGRSQCEHDHSR